ncbi:MAG TPA: RNA methyltransferase [Candidatus Cloacimonetes bacterium]|mgnify:FL=1|jgi:hypothetical protein|nr:RNA methyltransferase [Candidatus Cloacimonadota bacterium]
MASLHIALIHYPVLNKAAEQICSSLTNLDIHDIARLSLFYGVTNYWIVHPQPEQQKLLSTILDFWNNSRDLPYNPSRSEALGLIKHTRNFDSLIDDITTQEATRPTIISTTARTMPKQISFNKLKTLHQSPRPLLLVFGTAYGLDDEIHSRADHILAPLTGAGDYNHLSVRSAVAVILDRITSG